jgi:hypothetical protein
VRTVLRATGSACSPRASSPHRRHRGHEERSAPRDHRQERCSCWTRSSAAGRRGAGCARPGRRGRPGDSLSKPAELSETPGEREQYHRCEDRSGDQDRNTRRSRDLSHPCTRQRHTRMVAGLAARLAGYRNCPECSAFRLPVRCASLWSR